MRARLMSYWQKLRPPPIPSPYTINPRFARLMRETLTKEVKAKRPMLAIEFGCAHGFSTSIIAEAMPFHSEFWVFDFFEVATQEEVIRNVGYCRCSLHLRKGNIWYWLQDNKRKFDFLWLDAAMSATLVEVVHERLHENLEKGAVILFEGGRRYVPKVPHKLLVNYGPGIGKLLP